MRSAGVPASPDIVGNALLLPTDRYNNIRNLSDFRATGNFELIDSPLTAAQTWCRWARCRPDRRWPRPARHTPSRLPFAGTLDVNGMIVGGVNDDQSRPGTNVFLSANNMDGTAGLIVIAQADGGPVPVIAAVPSGTQGGQVALTADSIMMSTGLINAGTVDITGNSSGVVISGGNIVAVTGTIGFDGGPVTISGNAVIATVNDATDIDFSSDLSQSGDSYIGANGAVNVSGLLSQTGGQLITVSDVTAGGVAQTAGLISAGGNFTVGTSPVLLGGEGTPAPARWMGRIERHLRLVQPERRPDRGQWRRQHLHGRRFHAERQHVDAGLGRDAGGYLRVRYQHRRHGGGFGRDRLHAALHR